MKCLLDVYENVFIAYFFSGKLERAHYLKLSWLTQTLKYEKVYWLQKKYTSIAETIVMVSKPLVIQNWIAFANKLIRTLG